MINTTVEDDIPGIEWSAVSWAILVGGLVFLIVGSIATALDQGGNAWSFLKLSASMILGQTALFNDMNALTLVVGLVNHMIVTIISTIIFVLVINRWGLLVGIIGGGLLGLALYAINFYFISDLLFPWLSAIRSTGLAVAHIIFGAVAGLVYELLDVD